MKIVKEMTRAMFDKWMKMPHPENLTYDSEEKLAYWDFTPGGPATDVEELREFCRNALWFKNNVYYPDCKPEEYAQYLAKVVPNLPAQVFHYIRRYRKYTHVHVCHGDLTLYNVVQLDNNFTFLDPGDDRGLHCMEQDESKILQSLDGFGKYHANHLGVAQPWPHWVKKIHIALLIAHYHRMQRHVRHLEGVWAMRRADQLTEICF